MPITTPWGLWVKNEVFLKSYLYDLIDNVTTVPLSVLYGGAKPLGPWVRTSNFVPCE